MEYRISATDLARRLGDVLGRIRYRGDVFTVERNGTPVAVIRPAPEGRHGTVRDALMAWRASRPDPELASDLERVGRADPVPDNPWDS
jgi:antitoxin (DNA-binding transcriptional repressor) of toxin-antitoxin stability system